MENLPYVEIIKEKGETGETEWSGISAIRMKTCPFERIRDRNQEDFYKSRILQQMDFINALFQPAPKRVYALRYISRPNEDSFSLGRVEIVLLCKMVSNIESDLQTMMENHLKELIDLLGGFLPNYTWQPIFDRKEFLDIWTPFDLVNSNIVEIARREDLVPLETMRPRPVIGQRKRVSESHKERGDTAFFVHKFIPRATSFARLIRTMLLQSVPVMWQVALSPVWLSESEEKAFESEITKCELRQSRNIFQGQKHLVAETNHQLRAKTVSEALFNQLVRLEDAPFLMSIHVCSPAPIPQYLIEAIGIEITAPIGVPRASIFGIDSQFLHAGGYDTLVPANEEEARIAYNNLTSLNFEIWKEAIAPPGLKRARLLVDALEASCAFRFPVADEDGLNGVDIVATRIRPTPKEVAQISTYPGSKDKLLLGENNYLGFHQEVCISEAARKQHVYTVGQTGTGKSTLLKSMIISDMENGKGIAVIDPHGDLFEDILASIPEKRLDDVVVFDPTDTDQPVGLNLLECKSPDERYFIIREAKAIFERLFKDQYGHEAYSYTGPLFYRHVQMNMLLAMSDQENPGTLLEFYQIFQSKDYWEKWLPLKWKDVLLQRWINNTLKKLDYTKPLSNELSMGDYVSSKFEDFIFDPKLRLVFGQKISTIDFRDIMDTGKILLVNLSKGALSEANSRFLGMVLMAKIQAAAMQRVDLPQNERRMFYLYVDEFQSIATQNFVLLLSEARKFGVGLILANQFVSQIKDERIVQSIFGNVGTIISFRVGFEDAKNHIEPQFSPYFDVQDLINLPNWHGCVKTVVNGQVVTPFSIKTVLPKRKPDSMLAQRVKEISRKKYGTPRTVVEEQMDSIGREEISGRESELQ